MSNQDPEKNISVLLLAEDFYPKKSGGAFIDWNVAKHLTDCGDNVTVVTTRIAGTKSREAASNVDIRRPFPGSPENTQPNSLYGQLRRILFVFLVFPYLIRLMWNREFDVIYSTNHLFHPLAAVLRVLFGVPLVTFVGYSPSIHDNVSLTDPLVLLERMNFRFFMGDRALCRTPSIEKEISRLSGVPIARLEGIVDPEEVNTAITQEDTVKLPPENETEDTVWLIFVGRLTTLKNPIKAVDLLSNLPEDYSLLLIGHGPQRDAVEDSIHQKSLDERVFLAGQLPHKQTLRAIHGSDLLLLPSKMESYGAVVFEALSLNTPVLATPVGILPSINHPHLTIAQEEEFEKILPKVDLETNTGVDDETLERFSVNRFTREARAHLIKVTS
ncbi:glycosyltransferase family 4 protein [Natronosalvus rutilus]|uniref:Glycosyltransferase family 4 protein n=1 Tax=Natronosalvus rutilus TaxID=2953753 RepID=A0A9E7ND67_9EURY|nr:glycosyltransferase family 4 protein [Natronosalvus rutilus]UTF54800.1 glycosyltransferase family 4 protein [Natronosalvus rutilus]